MMNRPEPDVQAIVELEDMAREAARAKDLDRYISAYAKDAVLFWPGVPMISGRDAIREFIKAFWSMADSSQSFETVKVVVSRNGDLAYSYGTVRVTLVDPKGRRMKDDGKYLSVYRKETNGQWKVIADMGNSSLPALVPV
jgi:uncharacterized protein (TIGR02246 family)